MDLIIEADGIYTEGGVVSGGTLHIKDGYICNVYDESAEQIKKRMPEGTRYIKTPHRILPGLLDMHIHGTGGCDVMDCSIASLEEISRRLAADGVTGFLATTLTDRPDRINEALSVVKEASRRGVPGASILGAYVEGPYISEKQKGAHPAQLIRQIDLGELRELVGKNDIIRVMAIAPEKENAIAAIAYLKAHKILPAMGHTDAGYEEAMAAIDKGATLATHTYNGMRGLHHREPGVLGAVLTDSRVYAEVIADLVHVHPAAVSLLYRCKQWDKLCLISDCMCAAGLADGDYYLGQEQVRVREGVPRTQSGGLAGSTLRLLDAVKNLHLVLGIDLAEAVHMASLVPARILGLDSVIGSIRKGKKADFIIADKAFRVMETYISGKCVYKG